MDSFYVLRIEKSALDWVVYQAEGMISGQAGVSVGEAAFRLDEYARSHGETKHDVAVEVVERRLRFAA
jgi:hypothetical protein